jgi:hypothetical protein
MDGCPVSGRSTQLGVCRRWRVRAFERRAKWMCVEGCDPTLGATIVLRGAEIEVRRTPE